MSPNAVKRPVLSVEDDRMLLDSILTDFLQGMRDRALIGVMLFPLREFRLSWGSQLTSSNGF